MHFSVLSVLSLRGYFIRGNDLILSEITNPNILIWKYTCFTTIVMSDIIFNYSPVAVRVNYSKVVFFLNNFSGLSLNVFYWC